MNDSKQAVRIHLYSVEDVMRPRGPLKKESLGELVYDRAKTALESWTDPEYGDSRPLEEVFARIALNARSELELALRKLAEEQSLLNP